MATLTRDTLSDEKFARFLTRLERLAKIVTDKDDVQQFLINKHFRRALTPNLKSLLQEREKTSETPTKIASFLDSLGKNKRSVDLHSIESTTQAEIHQLNEKFDSLKNELKNELREILRIQSSRNYECEQAELNAVKLKPRVSRPEPSDQRTDNFPPHWEINRYGRPYRCRKCGILGHRDENCRGTKLVCRICNQPGHIQPACPRRNQNQLTKNF